MARRGREGVRPRRKLMARRRRKSARRREELARRARACEATRRQFGGPSGSRTASAPALAGAVDAGARSGRAWDGIDRGAEGSRRAAAAESPSAAAADTARAAVPLAAAGNVPEAAACLPAGPAVEGGTAMEAAACPAVARRRVAEGQRRGPEAIGPGLSLGTARWAGSGSGEVGPGAASPAKIWLGLVRWLGGRLQERSGGSWGGGMAEQDSVVCTDRERTCDARTVANMVCGRLRRSLSGLFCASSRSATLHHPSSRATSAQADAHAETWSFHSAPSRARIRVHCDALMARPRCEGTRRSRLCCEGKCRSPPYQKRVGW